MNSDIDLSKHQKPLEYPLVAIVGATASGKSDFALDLACAYTRQGITAEIVCADAFQLYRGMDIGTAKVTQKYQRGFAHHQLDVLDISETASVAAYQKAARADIERILSRGNLPILVGGSGLYVRAVLDQISFPGGDEQVRKQLYAQLEQIGPSRMHQRLQEVDPISAARLNPADTRRVVRALEVFEATGELFSASLPKYQYYRPSYQYALNWDMELLDQRIEIRSQLMFEQGLVQEVQALVAQGLKNTPTAIKATGYAQVISYLEGENTQAEAIADLALATRQLARKQRKWFRRDPRINWIDGSEYQLNPEKLIEKICQETLTA